MRFLVNYCRELVNIRNFFRFKHFSLKISLAKLLLFYKISKVSVKIILLNCLWRFLKTDSSLGYFYNSLKMRSCFLEQNFRKQLHCWTTEIFSEKNIAKKQVDWTFLHCHLVVINHKKIRYLVHKNYKMIYRINSEKIK